MLRTSLLTGMLSALVGNNKLERMFHFVQPHLDEFTKQPYNFGTIVVCPVCQQALWTTAIETLHREASDQPCLIIVGDAGVET